MENILNRAIPRKRRHKSHGARSGREDKSRRLPLMPCKETRKIEDCNITQNRLTMRMGLFNKGRESDVVLRTDGGRGDKGGDRRGDGRGDRRGDGRGDRRGDGRGDERESRGWQSLALYEGLAETFRHHQQQQPKTRDENGLRKEESDGMLSSAVGGERRTATDTSSCSLLSSPNIKKLSLSMTEHIDPKRVLPSGYLQRARKYLQDQYKAALQSVEEEEKENMNLGSLQSQTEYHGCCLWLPHQTPLSKSTQNRDDADATAATFWWSSSSAGAKRIPPSAAAAAAASMPPPHLSLNATETQTTAGRNPSSVQMGKNVKDLDDGWMRNRVNFTSQPPLFNIIDGKGLLGRSDFVCRGAKQGTGGSRAAAAASSSFSTDYPTLSGLGLLSFASDNPASDPSSSEWTFDLDHACLKYIPRQSTRKTSNMPYFNQTDGERDVLDIAETNQMASTDDDYMPPWLSSDHGNALSAAAAGDAEEHLTGELGVRGCLRLKSESSQTSMDEALGPWEMQSLPKLLLATVQSPSPKQKYYRRKIF